MSSSSPMNPMADLIPSISIGAFNVTVFSLLAFLVMVMVISGSYMLVLPLVVICFVLLIAVNIVIPAADEQDAQQDAQQAPATKKME